MYQNRLKDIGYDFEVNKTVFSESILRHFEEYGLQEQSDNKNKILVFPEGMQKPLKDVFKNRDYQSEALPFFQKLQKSAEMNCSETKMLSSMEVFEKIVTKVISFN